MSGIKVVLIALCIVVSSIHAASMQATQVTKEIAKKGRSKLIRAFGPKVHSKVENMIQEFELVAPDIIDQNMAKARKEMALNPKLSQKDQHKIASKYGKEATREIKVKMPSISRVKIPGLSEQTNSLKKRNSILSGTLKVGGTIAGLFAMIAGLFILGLCLGGLVKFLQTRISFALYNSASVPGPYDPYAYNPYNSYNSYGVY
jgi:hypothetical protein